MADDYGIGAALWFLFVVGMLVGLGTCAGARCIYDHVKVEVHAK